MFGEHDERWDDVSSRFAAELAAMIDTSSSHWLNVDQARIDASPKSPRTSSSSTSIQRAAATAFGGPIGHGFLTLSLLSTHGL